MTNKPATFPPAPHHHDSRYVQIDNHPAGESCASGTFIAGVKSDGSLDCKKVKYSDLAGSPPSSGGGGGCMPGYYMTGNGCYKSCPAGYSTNTFGTGCDMRGP